MEFDLIKDISYFALLLISAAAGFYTIKFKTEKNKIRIENLTERLTKAENKTDVIHSDLVEVKGLLMEIKGYLKTNKK